MLRSLHARSLLGALSVVVLLLAGCQSQPSQDSQTGPSPLPDDELTIEDPWVRPAPPGSTTALSMTIANGRQTPDTLIRARAPIIDSSVVQRASADGSGAAAMGPLPIPARTRMTLAPESTHVRLVNLGQSLDENSTLILNLEFAQSGLQRIRAPVQSSAPTEQ